MSTPQKKPRNSIGNTAQSLQAGFVRYCLYKYRNALRSGRFSVILQLFGGNFFCGLFGKSLEVIPVCLCK